VHSQRDMRPSPELLRRDGLDAVAAICDLVHETRHHLHASHRVSSVIIQKTNAACCSWGLITL